MYDKATEEEQGIFPKVSGGMVITGGYMMGAAVVLYVIATVFLTLDNARIVTP
jgi:hypothetical protein